MGLVINPTGYRIGHTKYWQDSWYLHRMNYPVFVHKSLEMKLLMDYCLRKRRLKSFWVYSHITFHSFNNKFIVNVFLYDGVISENYFNLSRNLKWRYFRKLKFMNRFTKKQLLDRIYYYQRWWLLCQIFGFELEHLMLDEVKWHIKAKHWRKITSLKQRYGFKWMSREELLDKKNIILLNRRGGYVYLGMKRLNVIFKRYVMRNLKFNLRLKKSRVLRGYNEKNFERANHVLYSYRKLFMFFSFFDKFARIIPSYPTDVFNKIALKNLFKFFRMYFVFKPYWTKMAKFYQILFLYININSKIKIYFLDNPHISAQFLAHYIMSTFKYRFTFNDTMIPIKKTLWRIMKSKNWEKPNSMKHYAWDLAITRFRQLVDDRFILYKDLYFISILKLVRRKLIKYLRLRPNRYYNRRVKRFLSNTKVSRFRLFNNFNLKRNLTRIKSSLFGGNFILKRKYFNIRRKTKLPRLSVLYSKKRLLYILKFRVLKPLFVLHKSFLLHVNWKYFYMPIKRKTKVLRYHSLSKTAWVNLINIKAKFAPSKRKLRRVLSKLLRLRYLKIKKNLVLRSLYISLFFLYIKRNSRLLVNATKFEFSRYSKLCWTTFKSNLYWRIYLIRHYIEERKYKRQFYRKHHIRPKKHYKFSFRTRRDHSILFMKRKIRIRARRKFFLIGKKWKIKIRYFFIKKKKMFILYKLVNLFKFFYQIFNYFPNLYLPKIKKAILHLFKGRPWKFSTNNKFTYFKLLFKRRIKKSVIIKKRLAFKYVLIANKFARGYFPVFVNSYMRNYSKKFMPFIFNLDFYGEYLQKIKKLPFKNTQIRQRQIKKRDLKFTPLINKFRRLSFLQGKKKNLLYGYKFHFSGRFTRKQKAASLWYAKGANPVSSMDHDVEYGFHTSTLRYSACTLKIWLYKNRRVSYKYGYRLV
jgi:hypothetical protein